MIITKEAYPVRVDRVKIIVDTVAASLEVLRPDWVITTEEDRGAASVMVDNNVLVALTYPTGNWGIRTTTDRIIVRIGHCLQPIHHTADGTRRFMESQAGIDTDKVVAAAVEFYSAYQVIAKRDDEREAKSKELSKLCRGLTEKFVGPEEQEQNLRIYAHHSSARVHIVLPEGISAETIEAIVSYISHELIYTEQK